MKEILLTEKGMVFLVLLYFHGTNIPLFLNQFVSLIKIKM